MAALSRLRKPVRTNRSIQPLDMLELGAVETASSLRIGHGAGAADAYSATRADCGARSKLLSGALIASAISLQHQPAPPARPPI